MTLDSALLYRSTDSLILPTRRRFYPFKIPNSHHQLRHYISTADPGRIYVAVGRIIYTIHIAARKREILTVVPFDPKCLTAGFGWIGVGGSENGDCAFIKLGDSSLGSPRSRAHALGADIDSPLPLDLDAALRRLPPRAPEVLVQEFGGSIVNSVTLHRFPASDVFSHEDVAVLSNNDKTVSIFSLTRMEMIETLRHPVCMNFATISPDSRILAAVGDANQIWFYRAEQVPDERDTLPNGDGFLPSWKWPRIGKIDLDSDPNYDDQCCFTIAFSPCSSLCAVGSQGGIITIFDVNRILTASPILRNRGDEVVCVFRSSRSFFDGGAIRCMTFSPRPWDLLVWVEDHGKIGVADMRQAFSRRQIVTLDMEEKGIEKIRTENLDKIDDDEGSEAESESQSSREPVRPPEESRDSGRIFRRRAPEGRLDTQTMREELARDLTARERQIIDFLNTARWASSIEDGAQRIPRYVSPLPLSRSPPPHGSRHSPLSTSPPEHFSSRHESARDRNVQRTRAGEPRRRSSVILSQDNSSSSGPSNTSNSALIPHPTITLRWTASPSQIPPSDSPFETAPTNPSGTTSIHINAQNNPAGYRRDGTEVSAQRARVLFDRSLGINTNGNGPPRQWGQRSRSIPRRSERPPDPTAELAADPPGGPTAEMRTNLAAERLRYQRRAAIEEGQRLSQWEQQYRRLTEFDQIRNNPRLRNLRGDFSSDRPREDMGIGTAGVGWGDDGRTLYVGTEEGIFEYRVNIQDRKTFPSITCR